MNRMLRACLVVPTMMVCATAMDSFGEESGQYARELVDLDRYVDVEKRAGQDPYLTLVVAISGGGYRAANFALGALLAMEQIGYVEPPTSLDVFRQKKRTYDSNLLNEVDYFSTVSGGGLAAAITVMSRLRASKIAVPEGGKPTCSGQGRRLLAEWMSSPGVLESLRENHTIRLVTSKFTPSVMFTSKTSGDVLQMRLDDNILRQKEPGGECGPKEADAPYVLGDVLPRKGGKVTVPVAPYLFMNSTNIATGQIVPLTPGWVDRKDVKEYWHGGGQEVPAGDNSCGPFCVPLALALRSSMNFPAGIPPTRLRLGNEKFVYLTDGGESDNLGSVTAVEILNQAGKGRAKRRMLIVIDAFRGLGRKAYDTEEIPGLVNSVLRATSLPLDAHRLRVKQDFYSATAGQPSVLDAISDAGDVSVAYVDMERETKALEIGTTLRLSPEQQQDLICAGKRQTLVALGKIDSWDQVKRTNFGPGGANFECAWDPDAAACPDGVGGKGEVCQGIVAFNQQSKTSLIGTLKEGFKRTMRRVRNPVQKLTPRLENAVAQKLRDHRRELILNEAKLAREKLAAPAVNLTVWDLRKFREALDLYANWVKDLLTQLGRFSSVDDAKPNDTADGASADNDNDAADGASADRDNDAADGSSADRDNDAADGASADKHNDAADGASADKDNDAADGAFADNDNDAADGASADRDEESLLTRIINWFKAPADRGNNAADGAPADKDNDAADGAPADKDDDAADAVSADKDNDAADGAPADKDDDAADAVSADKDNDAADGAPADKDDDAADGAPADKDDDAADAVSADKDNDAADGAPADKDNDAADGAPADKDDDAADGAPADKDDDAADEAPADKDDDAADAVSADKDEVSWWKQFRERAADWSGGTVNWLKSKIPFFDEEEVGEGGPPLGKKAGGTGTPDSEGAVDEKSLQEMTGVLGDMSTEVEEIKKKLGTRAINSRELWELAEEVFNLDRLHEKVMILVVELETGDSGNLSELFRDLSDKMGAPKREVKDLRKLLDTRFEDALARYAAASDAIAEELDRKLRNLENEVDKDVKKFKKGEIWEGALAVVKKVDNVEDIEEAIRNDRVCSSLEETKRQLEKALNKINGLTDSAAGEQSAWGFDLEIETRALQDLLVNQRKAINAVIHAGITEAERLLYFWPDLERRDRFTYEQFLSFRSLGQFAAIKNSEPDVEPPYERACAFQSMISGAWPWNRLQYSKAADRSTGAFN